MRDWNDFEIPTPPQSPAWSDETHERILEDLWRRVRNLQRQLSEDAKVEKAPESQKKRETPRPRVAAVKKSRQELIQAERRIREGARGNETVASVAQYEAVNFRRTSAPKWRPKRRRKVADLEEKPASALWPEHAKRKLQRRAPGASLGPRGGYAEAKLREKRLELLRQERCLLSGQQQILRTDAADEQTLPRRGRGTAAWRAPAATTKKEDEVENNQPNAGVGDVSVLSTKPRTPSVVMGPAPQAKSRKAAPHVAPEAWLFDWEERRFLLGQEGSTPGPNAYDPYGEAATQLFGEGARQEAPMGSSFSRGKHELRKEAKAAVELRRMHDGGTWRGPGYYDVSKASSALRVRPPATVMRKIVQKKTSGEEQIAQSVPKADDPKCSQEKDCADDKSSTSYDSYDSEFGKMTADEGRQRRQERLWKLLDTDPPEKKEQRRHDDDTAAPNDELWKHLRPRVPSARISAPAAKGVTYRNRAAVRKANAERERKPEEYEGAVAAWERTQRKAPCVAIPPEQKQASRVKTVHPETEFLGPQLPNTWAPDLQQGLAPKFQQDADEIASRLVAGLPLESMRGSRTGIAKDTAEAYLRSTNPMRKPVPTFRPSQKPTPHMLQKKAKEAADTAAQGAFLKPQLQPQWVDKDHRNDKIATTTSDGIVSPLRHEPVQTAPNIGAGLGRDALWVPKKDYAFRRKFDAPVRPTEDLGPGFYHNADVGEFLRSSALVPDIERTTGRHEAVDPFGNKPYQDAPEEELILSPKYPESHVPVPVFGEAPARYSTGAVDEGHEGDVLSLSPRSLRKGPGYVIDLDRTGRPHEFYETLKAPGTGSSIEGENLQLDQVSPSVTQRRSDIGSVVFSSVARFAEAETAEPQCDIDPTRADSLRFRRVPTVDIKSQRTRASPGMPTEGFYVPENSFEAAELVAYEIEEATRVEKSIAASIRSRGRGFNTYVDFEKGTSREHRVATLPQERLEYVLDLQPNYAGTSLVRRSDIGLVDMARMSQPRTQLQHTAVSLDDDIEGDTLILESHANPRGNPEASVGPAWSSSHGQPRFSYGPRDLPESGDYDLKKSEDFLRSEAGPVRFDQQQERSISRPAVHKIDLETVEEGQMLILEPSDVSVRPRVTGVPKMKKHDTIPRERRPQPPKTASITYLSGPLRVRRPGDPKPKRSMRSMKGTRRVESVLLRAAEVSPPDARLQGRNQAEESGLVDQVSTLLSHLGVGDGDE